MASKAIHIYTLPVVRPERSLAPDSNTFRIDRRRRPASFVSLQLIDPAPLAAGSMLGRCELPR
jgi:hypothetical protein